jgi:hypothetical protein
MSAKRTKISPRIRIREDDGSITTRPASTNGGRAVGKVGPFDDQHAIVFSQSDSVLYPVMLPDSDPIADVTGIVATGRPTPGAADIHRTQRSQTISAFTDAVTLHSTSFYLDPVKGLEDSFPGTLSSRIAIEIDITSPQEKYMYRCPKRHIDSDPTEFSEEGTGFYYFNFVNMSWDTIGNEDPLTGSPQMSDQAATFQIRTGTSLTKRYYSTSSVHYVGQFIPPSHYMQRSVPPVDYDNTRTSAGYPKIGTPTAAFLAPSATKYHAKERNTIKMSRYISHPFLLEKIRVVLPVVARRTHSSSSYYNPLSDSYAANDLHCRDMDNYVVFLYRQVRNAQSIALQSGSLRRDAAADVSGSDRFLIASASMCFYNSPTFIGGRFGNFTSTSRDATPAHSPHFAQDFKMPVAPGLLSNPPLSQSFYTGSVVLEMVPSIYASGLGGSSFLPSTMSNGEDPVSIFNRDGWRLNYFQHAWPGTAGIRPLGDGDVAQSSDYSGKTTGNIAGAIPVEFSTYTITSSLSSLTSSYTNILNVREFDWQDGLLTAAGLKFEQDSLESMFNPDPRAFRTIFGPGSVARSNVGNNTVYPVISPPQFPGQIPKFLGGASSYGLESSNAAPIVLLPTDELVLGIDAGIAPFMRDASTITGSFLKIQAAKASLVLYGSQIVNGEKRQHVKFEQSRSESVHLDDVDTPVLDEFFLDPLTSTMRNYHAPLSTGSLRDRALQSYDGFATNLKVRPDMIDWWKYPRQVSMVDDRARPVDRGVFPRFVFRNDKFGQPANILASPPSLAASVSKETILPGSKTGGTRIESYPVTNVFTGSTTFSGNTSLHATSSRPFSDTDS